MKWSFPNLIFKNKFYLEKKNEENILLKNMKNMLKNTKNKQIKKKSNEKHINQRCQSDFLATYQFRPLQLFMVISLQL